MNNITYTEKRRSYKRKTKQIYMYYSIICLFRNAVGPDEKFGLDRVRITESFMFRLRDKREMRTDQF